jgi:hypothetical protein
MIAPPCFSILGHIISVLIFFIYGEYKITENNLGAGACSCERPKDAKAEHGLFTKPCVAAQALAT